MAASVSRSQLVEQARTVPKDLVGLVSFGGYLIAIVGFAGLVVSGIAALGGAPAYFDWRFPAVSLLAGGAMTWWAGGIIGRRFVRSAEAAGYSPDQIREIEDEAERLNEEED